MSSGSSQEKIPFEPRPKKKKNKPQTSGAESQTNQTNNQSKKVEPVKVTTENINSDQTIVEEKKAISDNKNKQKNKKEKKEIDRSEVTLSAIPEVVSKRMIKRMAIFSGVPTFLGFLSFIAFYFVVTKGNLEIPNVAVLIVSIILFGSGFLGLSYGIFSTSWDENRLGSLLGFEEFSVNFGRTISAWKDARKKAKNKKNQSN